MKKQTDAVAVISSYVGQGDSFHGDFQLTGALRVDGKRGGLRHWPNGLCEYGYDHGHSA